MSNSAGKIFHSNDNYTVYCNADGDGYDVRNDYSEVIEFKSESLPECIFAAENLNVVLVHRTFDWISKRAADRAAQEAMPELAEVTTIQ